MLQDNRGRRYIHAVLVKAKPLGEGETLDRFWLDLPGFLKVLSRYCGDQQAEEIFKQLEQGATQGLGDLYTAAQISAFGVIM